MGSNSAVASTGTAIKKTGWQLHRPGLGASEEGDVDAAMLLTEELRRDQWQIPPLPRVAHELIQLANDPESKPAKIVALIERDVSLASRLLRLASSVAFGASKVTDLRRAVVKIGNAGLRTVALASAMSSAFKAGSLQRLARAEMEHAYVVAVGSAWVARRLGLDPAQAFMSGMLHDVGCLALLSVLANGAHTHGKVITPATALPVLANLHCDAGALVAHSWALDENVISAIRLHHMVAEATVSRATLAVALADAAEEIHHPDAEEHMRELMNHPSRIELNLGHADVLELVHAIADARNDGAANAFGGA